MKLSRIVVVGFEVEKVEFLRQSVIAELGSHEIARPKQASQPHISGVILEADIVAKDTTHLMRLVVAPERSPCRNADNAVETDVVLHHHIHHASREQASHSSAFQYQSCLHRCKSTKLFSILLP